MTNIPRIIPKLDIKGPNLVKGINLEGLRVLGNPRDFIKFYYESEADELIYHDVVASLYLRNNLDSLLKKTSQNIFIPIIVGGGIRSKIDVKNLIASGADRVFLNTETINNPLLVNDIVKEFGSSTVLISIEASFFDGNYYCLKDFGREKTKISIVDRINELQDKGVGELIITSVDKDGTGKGFDLNLAEKISKFSKIPFIINGGFNNIKDIDELLDCCLPSGIAISSAFHYNSKIELGNFDNNKEGNFEFIKKKKNNFLNFKGISIKDVKKFVKKKLS